MFYVTIYKQLACLTCFNSHYNLKIILIVHDLPLKIHINLLFFFFVFRVVFPEILNLNSFIPKTNQEADTGEENNVKCDDSSTTDSGSALDDESCHAADSSAAAVNGQDLNCQEEDEGK